MRLPKGAHPRRALCDRVGEGRKSGEGEGDHSSRLLREVGLSRTAGVNLSIAPNPFPEVRSNPSPITRAQGSATKNQDTGTCPEGECDFSSLFSP